MVQLNIQLINAGTLDRRLSQRLRTLVDGERAARAAAAAEAARVTRSTFGVALRPPDAQPRRGRAHPGGNMLNNLRWEAGPTAQEAVRFDLALADKDAPYWIIQEIGTGHSTTMRRGGSKNPQGRPKAGASYVRSVPSQVGRALSPSLAFGTSPTGAYAAFGSATNQQLYLRSMLTGAPPARSRRRPGRAVTITQEIPARHMVQQGGAAGFREYQTSVLTAARRAFAGAGRRP